MKQMYNRWNFKHTKLIEKAEIPSDDRIVKIHQHRRNKTRITTGFYDHKKNMWCVLRPSTDNEHEIWHCDFWDELEVEDERR
jgi:hypothetical protein